MTAFIGWVSAQVGGTPIKVGYAGQVMGANMCAFVQSWTKKTTDGNGTIYFLNTINNDALMHSLKFNSDALSGCTSVDCGLFNVDPSLPEGGGPNQTAATYYTGYPTSGTPSGTNAFVDAGAIFMSAVSFASGFAEGSEQDGLSNINVQTTSNLGGATLGFLNYGYKIWQLLGTPDPKWIPAKLAIGVRLNTAGSATGNLVIRGTYVEG
jgi:hypothetical protein